MKYYVLWSILPLVILFVIPMFFGCVWFLLGCCCKVKFIDRFVYAIVGRVIQVSRKKLKNDSEKKHNTLYGYKVARWGMYYFFFFIVYIFSASVGLLWSKFLVSESFQCKPRDEGLTCFNVDDGKEFDCPRHLDQSTDDNATDINIVCYKFVFAYGRAFVAAAGLFAGCTAAFGGISFTVLLFTTCAANCYKKKSPEKESPEKESPEKESPEKKSRLWVLLAVIEFGIIGIVGGIVYGILVWKLFVPLKLETSEHMNLCFVAITICYSFNFPWWAFQSKGSDGNVNSHGTYDGENNEDPDNREDDRNAGSQGTRDGENNEAPDNREDDRNAGSQGTRDVENNGVPDDHEGDRNASSQGTRDDENDGFPNDQGDRHAGQGIQSNESNESNGTQSNESNESNGTQSNESNSTHAGASQAESSKDNKNTWEYWFDTVNEYY